MKGLRSSVLLLLVALGACRPVAPYVRLTLSGAVAPRRIEITAELAGRSSTVPIERAVPIALPETVSLELPSDARGTLSIDVRAFDEAGLLGTSHGTAEITGPGVFDVSLAIGGSNGDGGNPSDGLVDLAHGPIALRAQTGVAPTTTSQLQIGRPGSIVPGDMMWIVLFVDDSTVAITESPVASGWTSHTSIVAGSCGGWRTEYFYKLAGAEEPVQYGVKLASATGVSASFVAFSNVDPVASIGAQSSGRFDKLPLVADLTPTAPESLLLMMIAMNAMSNDPFTAPTALPKVVGMADIAVFAGIQAMPGPSGSLSFGGPQGCGTFDFVALNPR